jgi:hypothetical protein
VLQIYEKRPDSTNKKQSSLKKRDSRSPLRPQTNRSEGSNNKTSRSKSRTKNDGLTLLSENPTLTEQPHVGVVDDRESKIYKDYDLSGRN